MPDIDFSKYRSVNFRVSGELERQLSDRGENLNSIAKRDLERYYDALYAVREHLQTVFSMDEALLLCDVLNGVRCTPDTLYGNIAACDEEVFGKWGVERKRFLVKIDELFAIEAQAVIDAVERAWNAPEYSINLKQRVVLVGLAK